MHTFESFFFILALIYRWATTPHFSYNASKRHSLRLELVKWLPLTTLKFLLTSHCIAVNGILTVTTIDHSSVNIKNNCSKELIEMWIPIPNATFSQHYFNTAVPQCHCGNLTANLYAFAQATVPSLCLCLHWVRGANTAWSIYMQGIHTYDWSNMSSSDWGAVCFPCRASSLHSHLVSRGRGSSITGLGDLSAHAF